MRWSPLKLLWVASACAPLVGCLSDGRPLSEYETWLKNAGELTLADATGSDSAQGTDAATTVEDGSAGPTCPQIAAGSQCSVTTGAGVTLNIKNTCSNPVDVYWVDYQCGEKKYLTIQSGTTQAQGTYVGHVWRVRDAASGALVAEIQAPTGTTVDVSVP